MLLVRQAEISDVELLMSWDEKPHVLDSDPNDEWNWEEELIKKPFWREQFIAEWNGVPVGVVQIIDPQYEETHYWGYMPAGYRAIDIWIGDENYLGRGIGTQMMEWVIRHCFSQKNVSFILVDPLKSNLRAHRFYEKLGFKKIEERTFGNDLCLIYRLEKTTG